MSAILSKIPSSIKDPGQKILQQLQRGYKNAVDAYGRAENRIVQISADFFPKEYAPFAEKAIRSAPEAIALASAFTGVGRMYVGAFLVAKTIYVLSPVVECAVVQGLEKDPMDTARLETKERMRSSLDRFCPALATSSAACAVFGAVIGVTRCDIPMMMYAGIHGVLSYVGYNATKL